MSSELLLEDEPVFDADARQDMFSYMPAFEHLTEEELEKWGIREGEDALEHARRCSFQIFGAP